MNVSVVFPYRAGEPHRDRAFEWVLEKFAWHYPDWEVVIGECDPSRPFNRSEAIIDGALKASNETLVISDADVWCEGIDVSAEFAAEHGWVVPYRLLFRLSEASTQRLYDGANWRHLELSRDNDQDRKPYVGNETGTALVIQRELLLDIPPDVRFIGWGGEDIAWGYALRKLHGLAKRTNFDIVHLWHPPQPRITRSVGNEESEALVNRYRRAAKGRFELRDLVDESKLSWSARLQDRLGEAGSHTQ